VTSDADGHVALFAWVDGTQGRRAGREALRAAVIIQELPRAEGSRRIAMSLRRRTALTGPGRDRREEGEPMGEPEPVHQGPARHATTGSLALQLHDTKRQADVRRTR